MRCGYSIGRYLVLRGRVRGGEGEQPDAPLLLYSPAPNHSA